MTAPVPPSALRLRPPAVDDEHEVLAAQRELGEEGFDFMLADDDQSWTDYLTALVRTRCGIGIAPGQVPATLLLAEVDGRIVGRVHLRHELNAPLRAIGGHVGYAVLPAYRRRGYATEMLRQAIDELNELGVTSVLVTCDDDNAASIRVIEGQGGVLEGSLALTEDKRKLRYWIHT